MAKCSFRTSKTPFASARKKKAKLQSDEPPYKNTKPLTNMKKVLLTFTLLSALICPLWLTRAADAPTNTAPAAAAPERSVTERLEDLEAYVNNGARNSTTNAPSKIAGPGPGHNGWMMTSAALVLFMTLPGLALFYGGLVRRKNVLSVLAQCFGIAGLVSILWWAVGYSFVFGHGSPFLGGFSFAFLKGVTSAPNTDYSYWVSQNVF